MKLWENRKWGILLIGLIVLGFILYIGYTGQDPTHGFQNKYLVVTKIKYKEGGEEGQGIKYVSEQEMNEFIGKLEKSKNSSTLTKEMIELVAQLPRHAGLRVPEKFTIEIYKWQWFQWRLIYRFEREFP